MLIETKLNLGDKVWFVHSSIEDETNGVVDAIKITTDSGNGLKIMYVVYRNGYRYTLPEERVFSAKDELEEHKQALIRRHYQRFEV